MSLPTFPYEAPQNLRRTARASGALFLALAILAPFSILFVPSQVLVTGDAAASLANLLDHERLFRLGLLVDTAVIFIEVVLTALLFRLLAPVDPTLSLMAAFARLAMTVVQAANLALHFASLRLADAGQAELLLVALEAHADVVYVWQVLFGLHCVLLGILVYRSGYLPRTVGVMMLAAAAGYLSDSVGHFLWPAYGTHFGWVVGVLAPVGELTFAFYVLIKGVRTSSPPRESSAARA